MVDYSKWKDIEISDDEDETHPNIDTPSLFRWRHQARTERMAEMEREGEDLNKEKKLTTDKLQKLREKCKTATGTELDELQAALTEVEKKSQELTLRDQDYQKKVRKAPWNVDTISKDGFAKTVINQKPARKNDEHLTEEQKEQKMKKFVNENEKLLKKFGMLRKYDDSKTFLMDNNHLVCEDTANYLVIWCLNLEMEQKSDLMAHVAHQCICMQFILELSKQLDIDPRGCVSSFFSRIQIAEIEYKTHFDNEVQAFKERIKARAQVKIQEALAEQEEEERQQRLGPGGLDPVEVFDSLPAILQKCFETRDIEMLQECITKLPEEEAKYHMKRCVESGLWVPDANKDVADKDSTATESTRTDGESSSAKPSAPGATIEDVD